jgi:peptidoglycan-N-acetylglucosamine deacetylase
VWLLDGVTAYNQIRAALGVQPAGIAVWQLGMDDPGVWASAGRHRLPDERARAALAVPRAGYDAFARVDGAVISSAPGTLGSRTLVHNPRLGLITGELMQTPPVQAKIAIWNSQDPKFVALTFDDGPDKRFTPEILDILAEKDVKATFYLIGRSMAAHPEIVRRIYAEGHDIGNHSYSHADMIPMSRQRVALELNGVQRLLESQLNINTILFRAPFAAPRYGEYAQSPQLTEIVSDLGYVIGGLNVDPKDFLLTRTADQIRRSVVDQVMSGGQSNTVLLHDSGANRRPTVEALGPLIDDLKGQGYRFVTTHELIGRSREEVMPIRIHTSVWAQSTAEIRRGYVVVLNRLNSAMPTIAFWATVLGIGRVLLIMLAALVQRRREMARMGLHWSPSSVAILVPGFNEEKVICKTVRSLLDSTISGQIEIIVIDDGSSDRTSEIVQDTFADDPRIKVFKKANGGKAAALNFGLARTDAEIIVAIDADTMLEPDAIELLVRHFNEARLGAVAGNAVVGNQINMMTRLQALEYVTSQNLDRRAFELFNAIPVVPGAIGAWRRLALLEVGGYTHDTLAEDADVTIALERHGWKVIYEPRARALTEAPETLNAFLKQRFRWMFGTLQVAFKNLRSPRGMPLGVALITIPNVCVFQFVFTLLAPIMDFLLLASLGTYLYGLAETGGVHHLHSLGLLASYWLLFQFIDGLVAIVAVRLDGDNANWALVPWVLVQRFTYRQLLYWTAVRTLLAAIKGQFVGWGKLLRTGAVALPKRVAT